MGREKKQMEVDNGAREIRYIPLFHLQKWPPKIIIMIARLNRALEELQSSKKLLAQSQTKKDELVSATTQESNKLRMEVKRLEKQKQDLMTGFKKQMQLIDNLKRQKIHLQTARLLAFTEEEFLKCLEWKTT